MIQLAQEWDKTYDPLLIAAMYDACIEAGFPYIALYHFGKRRYDSCNPGPGHACLIIESILKQPNNMKFEEIENKDYYERGVRKNKNKLWE